MPFMNPFESAAPWHALSPAQASARCRVDPAAGLDEEEVQRRLREHGPNALPQARRRPMWRTFARQLKSPLIYILFVAALLAVALGYRGDAAVILAVVLVNALIGAFQEGRAERSLGTSPCTTAG
jgi:magnesium-transporting ATPase (P-type)